MYFSTRYEAYNSSWMKFLALGVVGPFVGELLLPKINTQIVGYEVPRIVNYNADFIEKLPGLIFKGISTSYFIHNLYGQYQHNNSLEAQLKIEINGQEKAVTASPNYFDWYTAYNGLLFIAGITNIIGIGIGHEKLALSSEEGIVIGLICKIVSCFNDYQYYNFIDENGELISPEIIESANILDIKFNNIFVHTNDERVIDNNNEVETSICADETDNVIESFI